MSGTTTYRLTEISLMELDAKRETNSPTNSDDVEYFAIDRHNGYIYFEYPFETSGLQLYVNYYKKMTELDDDSDTTVIPDPDVLVEYAAAKIYQKREKQPNPNLNEFRRKLFGMLKHEKQILAQPTGLRQPVDGLGTYLTGLR